MCLHSRAKASEPLQPVANKTITKDKIISYQVGAVGTSTKSAKIFTR